MSTQYHAENTHAASDPFSFLYKDVYGSDSSKSSSSTASVIQYWKDHIQNGELPAMDEHGNNLLHLLASNGNEDAISELLKDRMLKAAEQLRVRNNAGDTPLHQAAMFDRKSVAEVLILHDPELCSVLNTWGETPAYVAAAYGWEEMVYFLKGKSDYDVMLLGRKDGWTVLHALVMAEHYDFAAKIIEEYPELADRRDNEGMTALHILASKPRTFRSGSKYTLINLGLGTFIPLQLIEILIYSCAPSVNWDVKSYGDVENPRSSSSSSSNSSTNHDEATPSSSPSLFSTFLSKISSVYEKIFTGL